MTKSAMSRAALVQENAELRARLEEAEETLRAIRAGEVDALIITDQQGSKIFTLKSADRPYRIMFETMAEGALTLAPNGTILCCNRRFAAMLESSPENLLGKAFKTFIAPVDQAAVEALLKPEPASSIDESLSLVTARGSFVPVHISGSLFTDDGIHAIAVVVTDLSAQLRDAAEIRRLNENLEKRIKERTAELETAYQEIESFRYSVSPDLRAPLRHIQGYGELLMRSAGDALGPQPRHYLDMVVDAARQMAALIEDLLSFSRMGRAERRIEQIALDELVHEAIDQLAHETEGRSIDWQIHPLPRITGDRSMMRLVLVNLLSNAVKFTRLRPRATIEVGTLSGKPDEATVYIRDNGVGFDMRYADKLFGVFQRLNSAEDFEGTGIGLANVKRVVTRHGGRVWAEGETNKGATFYFSLPREERSGSHEQ